MSAFRVSWGSPALAGLQSTQGDKLKKRLASAKIKELFCDPDIPATKESLFIDPSLPQDMHIEWKRPHELVPKPEMFVDGANRADVKQGSLGDCWFLAGAAVVASRPDLVKQAIPDGQVLCGEGYTGLVTFRFWRMGTWVNINIDDRLPVDDDGDLFYAKCRDRNEFWLPLMEKAFAKFHGGYKNIVGGMLPESLTSLTGYITQFLEPITVPEDDLFSMIRTEFRSGALITCSRGEVQTSGLVPMHAYSVTGARRVEVPGQVLTKLVRVRNPYGDTEWSGEWSDNDAQWKKLGELVKKEMEYHPEDDGEFWMKIGDFIKQFDGITFASKVPVEGADRGAHIETLISLRNAWVKGRTAGGSPWEDENDFTSNPQYLLTVKEPDDPDDCQPGEAHDQHKIHKKTTCSVTVEVVQEHNRKKFSELYGIGFIIFPYKKPKPYKKLMKSELSEYDESIIKYTEYMPFSSAVGRFDLEPGTYLIIPSTYDQNQCREFLLRIYCRKPITCKELM